MRVFVYGTLKSGGGNNYLLKQGELIGEYRTPPKYALYDLGLFPAMLDTNEGVSVHGEVWQVPTKTVDLLDQLESVPVLYNRSTIKCGKYGTCHVYFMKRAVMDNMFFGLNKPIPIKHGVWGND